MESSPYNATITKIEIFNEYTWVFHLTADAGQTPTFEPGQFTTLGLIDDDAPPKIGKDGKPKVKLIRRAYSFASAGNVNSHMEFLIILVDDGKLTPRLFKLGGVGKRLWLSPKISGDFTLDPVTTDKNVVLVGTGTGVAPYISMLRQYHGTGRWNKAVVVQGVRYEKDLAYRSELEQLAEQHDDFSFIPCVTRDDNWTGLKGRVPVAMELDYFEKHTGWPLRAEDSHVFLCGSPQMIDDMEATLIERGFSTHKKKQPGNIHLERYW